MPPSTSPSRAQSPHLTFAPEPAQTVPPMPDDDDGLALEEAYAGAVAVQGTLIGMKVDGLTPGSVRDTS